MMDEAEDTEDATASSRSDCGRKQSTNQVIACDERFHHLKIEMPFLMGEYGWVLAFIRFELSSSRLMVA